MLKVAAETFALTVKPGGRGASLMGHAVARVFTPLKSTFMLAEDEPGSRMALFTSHFAGLNSYHVSRLFRRRLAEALTLPMERVLLMTSHNHCCPQLIAADYAGWPFDPTLTLPEKGLTPEGQDLLAAALRSAGRLSRRLAPARVRYGSGRENRITHNRKGRRADGTTYFMREEDRLLLGRDFCGDIDDEAGVVGFFDERNRPMLFLIHFTGHPVTAYHCELPIVHGEFPQVACDLLSAAHGGAPTAFLQGCCGDVNSKGLLSPRPLESNVRDAERFGRYLGATVRKAARRLTPSVRDGLGLAWRSVELPFVRLPAERTLRARLAGVESFLARCEANDAVGTRVCDGLNFPSNMTPAYRKTLIEPTRQWLLWALSLHAEKRTDQAPKGVSLDVAALRLGDVGLVGMPCEPFQGIGRQIRRDSPLPLTLPCGYMNDIAVNYVPDAANCSDTEYMSSFYRYRPGWLMPYRPPAGDRLARAGVAMLEALAAEGGRP